MRVIFERQSRKQATEGKTNRARKKYWKGLLESAFNLKIVKSSTEFDLCNKVAMGTITTASCKNEHFYYTLDWEGGRGGGVLQWSYPVV